MKVTVFGTGYVGLVQGAVLSEVGHQVICVDVDSDKIDYLNRGEIPIYEPGLESLVAGNRSSGRLSFTTDAEAAVRHGDVIFIAVGTPPDEDGSADLKYVLAVAQTIARHMDAPKIVINKSTVPVGTADRVAEEIAQTQAGMNKSIAYEVASNPEFLKEGSAVNDCMRPDRIVIGSTSEWVKGALQELYEPFSRNRQKIIFMDTRSAELTKYAANCMLATKISFMNEMANLAEHLGADIEAVRQGIGSDERIGYHFIYPGCGYGGSCFPKDVQALIRTAEDVEYDAGLLKAVEVRNQLQKQSLFEKLTNVLGENLDGMTIALWGLSFKPQTNDMREAPSRVLMEAVWNAGGRIRAYDPQAIEECRRIYPNHPGLTLVDEKYETLENAEALVIVTEWKEFRVPDFNEIYERLRRPLVVDGRNLFDPSRLAQAGIAYASVGRQLTQPEQVN